MALQHHGSLKRPRAADELVSVSVGPHGEAVAVWASPEEAPEGGTPSHGRVTIQGSDSPRTVDVDLPWSLPIAQPLPDGRVLLVGSRCSWHAEGPDLNATILDDEGVVARGTLGDGISHVLTTSSGSIWVAYYDEGIFGNYGWGRPDGPEPVGSRGITRWTDDLHVAWQYPDDPEVGLVDDCYALNVDGEDAWACYYSDFPVVRIQGDTVTGWLNGVIGANALIIESEQVALAGGYREDRDRVVLGALTDTTFEPHLTARMTLPDGRPLVDAQLIGRGPELHAFVGTEWLKTSIEEVGRQAEHW